MHGFFCPCDSEGVTEADFVTLSNSFREWAKLHSSPFQHPPGFLMCIQSTVLRLVVDIFEKRKHRVGWVGLGWLVFHN